ncbi:MAG: hypothetical protein M1838_004761, partial [Thelocarpon superellum]
MSTTDSVPPSKDVAPTPTLDLSRLRTLPSEQQDLHLLVFTADLVRHVDALDPDHVTVQQAALKRELMQVIHLSPPAPSRVIRNNVARCFAMVFGRGNRRLLFETVNELLAILNEGKTDKDLGAKHAAVRCIGDIFEVAGDSVMSLSSEVASAVLRTLKPAQQDAGLRSAIFITLRKLWQRFASSADEQLARETWKQSRNVTSSDKANLPRRSAILCLEQLIASTPYFDNASDFESLRAVMFRAMDTPAPHLRHAAAACLATALVKVYAEDDGARAEPKARKAKKAKGKPHTAPDDDPELQRPDSPPAKKSPAKLTFGLVEILRQLSVHYNRTSTSNRARAGLAACYARLMRKWGERVVQTHYFAIADHFLIDLLNHHALLYNRYRLLITRRYVRVILETVIGREMLTQAGQREAATTLINDVLRNYPQVIKERPAPSKYTLTGALSALASLIQSLGSAMSPIAETCRDGLLQVLQHLSYTVQIATAHCLREFILACPQQLVPCLSICLNSTTRELGLLSSPRQSPRKCVGCANGLAAILSISIRQPLHSSLELNARILRLATELLKTSTNSELRTSATQIQVAWILIGGLMSLGPNFVKIHLAQFLLMWRNALPKSIPPENIAQRTLLELSFLAHVRECALGSILAFLESNSRLLTTDVSKRLAALLQNTTSFLDSLPAKKTADDRSQRLSPSLQLYDLDSMVRRRVLQCYTKLVQLSPAGGSETLLHSNLVTLAMSFFADPDNYSPSSLSTTIANSTSHFESVWDIGDNSGFGITGLVGGLDTKRLPGAPTSEIQPHWLTRKGADAMIDQTLLTPIAGAREHDSLSLYVGRDSVIEEFSDPPATEVVNAAIRLFALSFPIQPFKIQESILEQMATFLTATALQRDPGRQAAMTVNVALAILATLQTAARETSADSGEPRGVAVEKIMQELLRGFVVHPDQYVRNLGCAALGHLCSSSGNTFTTNEVSFLVDSIVSNRDPHARAGCAVALGCIHAQVGGMAAGYHLKNIFGVLISLIKDPHPTVHFWALSGLIQLIDSAGLTFSALVSSSLGILAQIYVADTHHAETALVMSSNLEMEWSTVAAIARCTDALINVLGPDLQDMSKTRDLILTMVAQLQSEEDPLVLRESLRCLEHLTLYASGHMDFDAYVRCLRVELASTQVEVRDAAIDGLYNVMKRDPDGIMARAGAGLEDQMWLVLDQVPTHEGVRNILRNWLHQTSLSQTARWVQRCREVLNKVKPPDDGGPVAPTAKSSGMPDLQDEEVAGFATAAAATSRDDSAVAAEAGGQPLKWQVQTFAMACLSELLTTVHRAMLAATSVTPAETALQQHVAEVIRMAFSASTSNVVELRVWGLRIIDQVLNIFGKTPDPDFAEASLLEQYQAQISSALTPAFTAESSPALASAATNVCASFIATGIVTDVDRMGRILKLLVSSLESFSGETETTAIGDLKGLSSNAQVMVRMAVYAAWAELQVASMEQKYLDHVLAPYIGRLTPLWLSSLKEFAQLRFEPDISMNNAPSASSEDLDTVYAALNRETRLKFYQDSWLKLVDAIASLIEQDSSFVFEALDGKVEAQTPNGTSKATDINYRDEPVAFFFVLFGIAFEALVGRSGGDLLSSHAQIVEVLVALKKILHPSVSGQAIYQEVVFAETIDLLDRLVLTEGLDVQAVIVDIVRSLCLAHPSAREGSEASESGENLSEDIDQLFELTRIIVLVLAGVLPPLSDAKSTARPTLSQDALSLIRRSLEALVDVAEVFPSVIKTDLYACIVHIFATILSLGSCQATVVPQALPIFKRFVQSITRPREDPPTPDGTVVQHLRGCLQRFLAILKRAQQRETEASVPCEKNTLLACTILVSSGTEMFSADDALVTTFLDETVECLDDRMTGQVAANCIRSITLASHKSGASESLAQHLFPRLLSFITSPSTSASAETSSLRTFVARTLTTFGTSLETRPQRATAFCLLLPALLDRASSDGESIFSETATRILELAGTDQFAFRVVVGGMPREMKSFMERVLREGGRRGGDIGTGKNGDHGQEPTIALKMDFATLIAAVVAAPQHATDGTSPTTEQNPSPVGDVYGFYPTMHPDLGLPDGNCSQAMNNVLETVYPNWANLLQSSNSSTKVPYADQYRDSLPFANSSPWVLDVVGDCIAGYLRGDETPLNASQLSEP